VTLVQRRTGKANRLELRLRGVTRLLDTSTHSFLGADVQHDAHGRMAVVWRRILEGDSIQAFAWTPTGGRQQISDTKSSVSDISLSISATGRGALAYWSPEGIFVARRSAGRGFEKPEPVDVSGKFAQKPGIGVSSRGRIVVAWSDGARVLARAATGAAPFGPAQPVALRSAAAGTSLLLGPPKVVVTSKGRAVVTVSSKELRGLAVADARVEAFDWAATALAPSTAATLSRGAAAGEADVVALGANAVIAWTQRPKNSPRALWTTRWTPKGLERPNLYDTHALGLSVLLTAGPRGAVDAFYRAGGPRWFTVRLTAAGRYRDTSVVTPPGEHIALIDVAASGGHLAASWTARPGRPRVQVARPAT
jgi:hypothetical protein